jgi:hypothetical protein
MRSFTTVPRLWVLAVLLAMAGPAFAFNWYPSARTNLSALGDLDQQPDFNRQHKLVSAKGTGDALAVWRKAYGHINQAYRQVGQTNWTLSNAFTSDQLGDAIFGDVSMNKSNDYIIAGITYRWSDFQGIVQDSKLMADLMIGGVKVSDENGP